MRTYDSRWQKVRLTILTRDNHLCQIAGPGCTTHATDVDHIIPINEGGQRLDPTNLRASCSHCNTRRPTQRRADLIRAVTEQATPSTSRNW